MLVRGVSSPIQLLHRFQTYITVLIMVLDSTAHAMSCPSLCFAPTIVLHGVLSDTSFFRSKLGSSFGKKDEK